MSLRTTIVGHPVYRDDLFSYFWKILSRTQAAGYIVKTHPATNAMQQTNAMWIFAADAIYRIPNGKRIMITVAGIFVILRTNIFFFGGKVFQFGGKASQFGARI